MQLSDLVIDWNETIGRNLMAVESKPVYAWVDGKKTDVIASYAISVVAPRMKFDKITVKIPNTGKVPLEFSDEEPEPIGCEFHGLTGKAYMDYKTGSVKFSISADSVEVVEE